MENWIQPGALVQKVSNATNGNIILYILIASFIVFVVWMLMGKSVNFSWLDIRPKSMVTSMSAYKFWYPGKQFKNLVADQNVPKLYKNSYCMMVDCILYNTRNYTTTEGPYRHLVHRGSNEFVSGTRTAPFGLPKRMNPGIFIDPNKNDILVFVDTFLNGKPLRESVRIADIPLDIPFRISVNVNGRVLEVYLNCLLEVTKVLSGEPRDVENVWYGCAGSAATQAQVQYLLVWNAPLTSDDLRSQCPSGSGSLPVFSKDLSVCDTSEPPSVVAPAMQTVDLGINAQLCNINPRE